MADQQVPIIRTIVTPQAYARAVISGWQHVGEGTPSKATVGVLFAQWMVETGGNACWNWNLSNAKHFPGDGHDYVCLNGVWEGVPQVTADNLIAAGRAIRDPSPNHALAVGPDKVSVIFPPPQPESRFRAFPDLVAGMAAHLKLLHDRFPAAWAQIVAGNPRGAGLELGNHGYFTASPIVYGNGMAARYAAFITTSAYDLALEELDELRAADTLRELPPSSADEPTIHVSPSEYFDPPDSAA